MVIHMKKFTKSLLLLLTLTFSMHAAEQPARKKILALAGSTRQGSYNQMLVKEAAAIATQQGAQVTVINLSDYEMPLYNADLEAKKGMPKKAKALRQLMMDSDAMIISSPAYNGAYPALLKNVIDWATRTPEGTGSLDAFKGKPIAIMCASPGRGGGVRGLVQLRQLLTNVGATVVTDEVAIPNASTVFDSKGQLIDSKQKDALSQEITQLLKSTSK